MSLFVQGIQWTLQTPPYQQWERAGILSYSSFFPPWVQPLAHGPGLLHAWWINECMDEEREGMFWREMESDRVRRKISHPWSGPSWMVVDTYWVSSCSMPVLPPVGMGPWVLLDSLARVDWTMVYVGAKILSPGIGVKTSFSVCWVREQRTYNPGHHGAATCCMHREAKPSRESHLERGRS